MKTQPPDSDPFPAVLASPAVHPRAKRIDDYYIEPGHHICLCCTVPGGCIGDTHPLCPLRKWRKAQQQQQPREPRWLRRGQVGNREVV